MQQSRQQHRLPYRRLCEATEVPYSSFMRWQARVERREPVLRRRGPKKVQFDFSVLRQQVCRLKHRYHRTHGTGQLYGQCRQGISRRQLRRLVAEVRREARRRDQQSMRRITWHHPGLVWSMDDTRLGRDAEGRKSWLHQVQDLASQHKFREAIVGDQAHGEEIAGNLAALFDRYGPPLILKRDNGGNLNHSMVEEVLEKYGVIPLNRPAGYPPYNGAVEHGLGEIKEALSKRLAYRGPVPREHLEAYAEAAINDVNHKERRALNGRTSCRAFGNRRERVTFSRRERQQIYTQIIAIMETVLEQIHEPTDRDKAAAYRHAVEHVLQRRGLISVTTNAEVLPHFLGKDSHN